MRAAVAVAAVGASVGLLRVGQCPLTCSKWWDGCEDCKCVHGKVVECIDNPFCTSRTQPRCKVGQTPSPTPKSTGCPKSCQRWFDGCNSCACTEGAIGVCSFNGNCTFGDAVPSAPAHCKTWIPTPAPTHVPTPAPTHAFVVPKHLTLAELEKLPKNELRQLPKSLLAGSFTPVTRAPVFPVKNKADALWQNLMQAPKPKHCRVVISGDSMSKVSSCCTTCHELR